MKEQFEIFLNRLNQLKKCALALHKYRGNKTYSVNYIKELQNLNREFVFLEAFIMKTNCIPKKKFEKLRDLVKVIYAAEETEDRLRNIIALETFWPRLEVEFQSFKFESFNIPEAIPAGEVRTDLEEAIKDYDNECFISAQVMCRRAYEGALRDKYKLVEGKDPQEDFNCPNCKCTIRKNSEISITKLHKWAVEKKIIHEKLQNVGFLIPEIGAGSAHPPKNPFPRDKEIAKLCIEASFALVLQVYKKQLSSS